MKRRTSRSEAWRANDKAGRSPQLPEQWRRYQRKKSRSRIRFYAAAAFVLGAAASALFIFMPPDKSATIQDAPVQALFAGASVAATSTISQSRTFSFCHTGGGTNCVVDGDTIWMDGVKIRVADIDAPETHSPRCSHEADLGNKATQRLLELVNAGPFEAAHVGSRDKDKYGRKLRVLVRNGRSFGDILVEEGLARTWDGARHPWC